MAGQDDSGGRVSQVRRKALVNFRGECVERMLLVMLVSTLVKAVFLLTGVSSSPYNAGWLVFTVGFCVLWHVGLHYLGCHERVSD